MKTKNGSKQSKKNSPVSRSTSDVSVLTLPEAAAYLRISESAVLTLVQHQGLPGRSIGDEWRFSRAALQDWLGAPCSRDRLLRHAGKAKDDPHLERIIKEIYQERDRQAHEESA